MRKIATLLGAGGLGWVIAGAAGAMSLPAHAIVLNAHHGRFIVAGVPEPSSWALMIIGVAAVGIAARNSRRKLAATSAA